MPFTERNQKEIVVEEQFGNVILLTEFPTETAACIRSVVAEIAPANRELFVLDFPLEPEEDMQEVRAASGILLGLRYPNTAITNLDHHIDRSEMWRRVSTVDLVAAYV